MTSILPPVSAPRQPDMPASPPSARSDEPDPNSAESFGAVLSRSLAPAAEAAGKADGKAASAAPARRLSEARKADPDDLLNAMAPPQVPLENLLPQTAAAAGAAAAPAGDAVPGSASPGLSGLLSGKTTLAQAAGGPMPAPAPVPEAVAETPAPQLTPAPGLAAASQKDTGLAGLPARLQAAAEAGPGVALATAGAASPSGAPDSGSAGQSSKQRDGADDLPQVATETSADSSPVADTTPGVARTSLPATAGPEATPAGASTVGQTAAADIPAASVTPAINTAISTAGVAAPAPAPAAVLTSSAAPAATTWALAPEVGSSEWGKALGQQMIHMGKGGEQVAELQLNPPGLGPLKVTLSMNDQQVQAMFVSAHSSVRAAVEAALPQLRTTLADNGISLGNTSVNSESQQQTTFAQGQNGQSGQRQYRSERVADTAVAAIRPAAEALRQGNGLSVDTYA